MDFLWKGMFIGELEVFSASPCVHCINSASLGRYYLDEFTFMALAAAARELRGGKLAGKLHYYGFSF